MWCPRHTATVSRVGDERQVQAEGASPSDLLAAADRKDRLADERDELAALRDKQADERDVLLGGLGRRERDESAGFVERHRSGRDRDHAVGDRDDAARDRAASRADREHASRMRQSAATDRRQAAAALAEASDAAEKHAADLETALASSRVIGQAMGILMSQQQVTSQEAFDLLRASSQRSNRKLRDLAAEIIRRYDVPPST